MSTKSRPQSLVAHFADLPDPRVRRTRLRQGRDSHGERVGHGHGAGRLSGASEDGRQIERDYRHSEGNQTRLHEDIRTFFLDAEAHAFAGTPHTTAETVDGGRGRVEIRRAWATDDLGWLADRRRWPGLRSVVRVDAERTVGAHTSRETRV